MKVQCKHCLPREGIDIPNFKQSEKAGLLELAIQSPILCIKYIIDNFKLNHQYAKYIATHINKNYGKCNRCDFDKLDKEYVTCPKCGALNFNWKPEKGNRI
jgi:hypothetical protein